MLRMNDLSPNPGAVHKKKRVGRGNSSGHGTSAGRGTKGQQSRTGYSRRVGFEGGQNPIHRRVPKRGFVSIFRVEVHGINVGALEGKFGKGDEVSVETLRKKGLIPKRAEVVKLLAHGEIKTALVIKLHRASEAAKAKIEAVGGKIELVEA